MGRFVKPLVQFHLYVKPMAVFLCAAFFALMSPSLIGLWPNAYALCATSYTLPEKVNRSITLSFAGDVHLGSDYGKLGAIENLYEEKGATYFLSGVEPLFQKDDLTILNLESPFTRQRTFLPGKLYTYRADPKLVSILSEGGVDLVNVVTNHMQDYQQKGFEDSLKILKRAKIGTFGTNLWPHKNPEIGPVVTDEKRVYEIRGIRVGFLGYTGFIWPNSKFREKILEDLQLLQSEADFVVVSMHWGGQNTREIRPKEREMAHFLIDNGADFIYGHHPHMLQKIETYKNKKIAYSLGNFIFNNMDAPLDRLSAVISVTITKQIVLGRHLTAEIDETQPLLRHGKITARYKAIPVYFNGTNEAPYRPQPIKDESEKKRVHRILGL